MGKYTLLIELTLLHYILHLQSSVQGESNMDIKEEPFYASSLNRIKRQTEDDNVTVRVEQGFLQGHRIQSAAGGTYIAFQGIPYAKPPLDDLRFKDPESPEPWNGTRDASTESNMCPQPVLNPVGIAGNEDCLYLNVYTPRIPPTRRRPLPVMFYIHGGGFVGGSGGNPSTLGPDFLIADGVIVVTTNYRLGALGFLFLREEAPGNVGLKDQVAALRWVRKNIHSFGGDPYEVTIFGQSAGGASVHYQMLSPMSRGLFRGAIAQSGNALDRWAQQTLPYETSQRLASAVGCPVGNDSETIECLRGTSIQTLIIAQFSQAPTQQDRNRLAPFTFVPTVDMRVRGVETFLPDDPVKIINEGRTYPVPFMSGITNNESIIVLSFKNVLNPIIAQEVDATWNLSLPIELYLPENCSTNEEALQALRDFFMDGKPLTNETFPQFLKMLTDILFGRALYYTLHIMAKYHRAPLYEYFFEIEDELNIAKATPYGYLSHGAAHTDDLGYLFYHVALPKVTENSTAWIDRQRMVRMWTNFAKYGNPTPFKDPLLDVKWKLYSENDRNYLDIGTNLRAGRNLNNDQVKFWNKFGKTYGCGSPSFEI